MWMPIYTAQCREILPGMHIIYQYATCEGTNNMTNEELVSLIQRTSGDTRKNYLEMLYNQNSGLIRSIAHKYINVAELDDLEQEGFLGLYVACDGFDSSQEASFSSYAFYWIRQSIIRYIRSNRCLRIPEGQLSRIIRFRDIEQSFYLQHNRKPTDKELTSLLHISQNQLEQLKKDALCYHVSSIYEPVQSGDGLITLEDTIQDKSEDAYMHIVDDEYMRGVSLVLWSVVDSLGYNESQIIRNRFQHNMSIEDAGDVIGLNPIETKSYHNKAIKELRQSSVIRKLYHNMNDIMSESYKKVGFSYFIHSGKSATEDAGMKIYMMREKCSRIAK